MKRAWKLRLLKPERQATIACCHIAEFYRLRAAIRSYKNGRGWHGVTKCCAGRRCTALLDGTAIAAATVTVLAFGVARIHGNDSTRHITIISNANIR